MQIFNSESEHSRLAVPFGHSDKALTTTLREPDFSVRTTLFNGLGIRPSLTQELEEPGVVLGILRNPELVLSDTDPLFRMLYFRTMIACLAGQLQAETVLGMHRFNDSVIVELPNGGTLTSRIVEHLLTENGIKNSLRTIDKGTYIKPIKTLFKNLLLGKDANPWQAVEPMVIHFKESHFPVVRHYVIPEDTIESGDTMVIVMKALIEHCHANGAPTPRFTLMVPTVDKRHLHVYRSKSRIADFSNKFNVKVQILYTEAEDYAIHRVPEHGDAHVSLTREIFG